MGPKGADIDDTTPDDVAALYAWANLTGTRYWDFSAVRREQRARIRLEQARSVLAQELESQTDASAHSPETAEGRTVAEAAATAALRAMQEAREMAKAGESARRKQIASAQAERQFIERLGPQPEGSRSRVPVRSPHGELVPSAAEAPVPRIPQRDPGGHPAISPAWLHPAADVASVQGPPPARPIPIAASQQGPAVPGATLLDSRRQVAARWPILQELIGQIQPASGHPALPCGPIALIVSPACGAGKTSLAATLALALANAGERVLLAETTANPLLPVYFAKSAAAEGRLTNSSGSALLHAAGGGSVSLATLDAEDARSNPGSQIVDSLLARASSCDRILVDVTSDAAWIARQLAPLRPLVLATTTPQINSLAGLRDMEQSFAAIARRNGEPVLPLYLLNCFERGLPLHLDIRELLRPVLGDRLLPVTVRYSAAVTEALAEGRTVLDYAPDSPVARDYVDLCMWMRTASPASADAIARGRGKH